MLREFSYFTGGGVAQALLHEIGVQTIGGVEYDPAIAAVYRQNYGDHIRVGSVMDVDAETLPDFDIFWASPECKEYSAAKNGGKEGPTQIAQAQAICRALRAKQPRYFFLENVRGYLNSTAFRLVRQTLDELGYWSTMDVCNCADFGVPQTRERIILRGVSGGMFQPYRPLPAPTPWIGWYEAIADLIPTLPESRFADWQLARLPEHVKGTVCVAGLRQMKRSPTVLDCDAPMVTIDCDDRPSHMPRAFLMPNTTESDVRYNEQPAHTTTSSDWKNMRRAFIVGGQYENQNTSVERHVQNREEAEPIWTITAGAQHDTRAFLVPGGNASSFDVRYEDEPARTVGDVQRVGNIPRAWLDQGRVVAMTPRALARFQSLPDTYILPDKRTLACTVIGNGAPSKWVKAVVAATIGETRQ